jgi:hypothetical protein
VLKIGPKEGPLFEKLQHSENFTKSAVITFFHCRLAISSKQKKLHLSRSIMSGVTALSKSPNFG